MNKFLQFCIISLFLLVGFIGCIFGCFAINNLFSLIILILLSILLFISSIYSFIFALSFKIGKKIKAIITDKQYIPSDNNDHIDNGYYKFIYQVNLNNKIETKSFKIYCYNDYLAKKLNTGNEIEVNKLLFVTSFDKSNITKNNNDLCQPQKKYNSIRLKKELIIIYLCNIINLLLNIYYQKLSVINSRDILTTFHSQKKYLRLCRYFFVRYLTTNNVIISCKFVFIF